MLISSISIAGAMPFVKFFSDALRLLPRGGPRFIIRAEGMPRRSRR
jgi:hypothetical protein